MITTFYPPYNFGGDGIGVQRLSRALVRRGHHVTVIHDADAFRALGGEIGEDLEPDRDGVEIRRLESRLGLASSLLTHQFGRPVIHGREIGYILERGNFDVIHFHNVSLVGGPGLLGMGSAIKLYTAREHWLVCPTHVLWRHARELCDSRECLRCVLRYRRPPQLWRYTGRLERMLRHVDVFIAKSEFSREKHAEFGFPYPMEVLPNFLPDLTDADAGPEQQSPHERPYFLFLGRLERIKGLDDVIPTFFGLDGADLLIAGEGEHGGHLKKIAGDAENVRFLGQLSGRPLARYLRNALALIVPSVCFETFGIVLIEAFREGTPVIARSIGPFPEIVELSEGGALFDGPGDLSRVLMRFLMDESYRRALGEKGRRAFQAHWSETAVMPRYLDIVRGAARQRQMVHTLERLQSSPEESC